MGCQEVDKESEKERMRQERENEVGKRELHEMPCTEIVNPGMLNSSQVNILTKTINKQINLHKT